MVHDSQGVNEGEGLKERSQIELHLPDTDGLEQLLEVGVLKVLEDKGDLVTEAHPLHHSDDIVLPPKLKQEFDLVLHSAGAAGEVDALEGDLRRRIRPRIAPEYRAECTCRREGARVNL